jgi:predicted nucleic acid-binding Zn ribbon protein
VDRIMSRRPTKHDIARWNVERERFQIADRNPPAPHRDQPLTAILPEVMKKIGLEQPMWEQTLLREWPAIVGPQVAQHTRPGRLERCQLYVYVANSAWLSELKRYGEKKILAKLQERFGTQRIKGLRLQLDPDQP